MRRSLISIACFTALGAPAGAQTLPACGGFPTDGADLACSCPAIPAIRSVWGSGPYTADSDVCTAALHAGVIGAEGGEVLAVATEGQQSYEGSTANGVQTRNWGSYDMSFTFVVPEPEAEAAAACEEYPLGSPSYTCSCDAGSGYGFVWGSGPYTADSDICSAAVHAGVIGPEGGTVTALALGGLDAYRGSESNGVLTRDWGSDGASIVFDANR